MDCRAGSVDGIEILPYFTHFRLCFSFIFLSLVGAPLFSSDVGAMALLVVSGGHSLEETLEKVEWGTLLFFGSLFILMEVSVCVCVCG